MVIVKQFGSDGATYDTNDYPYILMDSERVTGRFSTLEMAQVGRLMESLNNPGKIIMLFNEKTQNFIDWTKKDKQTYERYKDNPSKYFDLMRKKKWRK